jgi:DNA-binding beta-propeller fold protein YncE
MLTVTRLNWQVEVIGSYSGMSYPMGISLSYDGTVFVCDNVSYVIEEILGDCSTGKSVLENLNDPYTVSWCGETKKLYYSCHSSNEKIANFLYIYKLS